MTTLRLILVEPLALESPEGFEIRAYEYARIVGEELARYGVGFGTTTVERVELPNIDRENAQSALRTLPTPPKGEWRVYWIVDYTATDGSRYWNMGEKVPPGLGPNAVAGLCSLGPYSLEVTGREGAYFVIHELGHALGLPDRDRDDTLSWMDNRPAARARFVRDAAPLDPHEVSHLQAVSGLRIAVEEDDAMTFVRDQAGAIVIAAHPTNYGYGVRPDFRAIVIHTPEEEADDRETTPDWFANPVAGVSTHYYLNDDLTPARVIQMVPESEGAYGQGVDAFKRIWKGVAGAVAPWVRNANGTIASYNLRSIGIEVEGRAATIAETMPVGGPQWNALVVLIRDIAARHSIPLDRDHIVGHDEINSHKRDPGSAFPWAALMADLRNEDDEGSGIPEDTAARLLAVEHEVRAIREGLS